MYLKAKVVTDNKSKITSKKYSMQLSSFADFECTAELAFKVWQ
jgi:hypothetical protein